MGEMIYEPDGPSTVSEAIAAADAQVQDHVDELFDGLDDDLGAWDDEGDDFQPPDDPVLAYAQEQWRVAQEGEQKARQMIADHATEHGVPNVNQEAVLDLARQVFPAYAALAGASDEAAMQVIQAATLEIAEQQRGQQLVGGLIADEARLYGDVDPAAVLSIAEEFLPHAQAEYGDGPESAHAAIHAAARYLTGGKPAGEGALARYYGTRARDLGATPMAEEQPVSTVGSTSWKYARQAQAIQGQRR